MVAQASESPKLQTASTHPIQYYLSLPEGWTAGKKWPVVVIIDSADREFLQTATTFAQARQHRPFILITPLVVTNGGAGYRSVPTYHYSDAVWERIQDAGAFRFDMDGIAAIMQDVVKQYSGEDKYFITGLEAAGHTIWGIVFNHPEVLRGAAIVCSNYLGRWVDEAHISSAAERTRLPVRNFIGSKDELCSPGHPIYTQMQKAISIAEAHGYGNVSITTVEGKGHERFAEEVLAYFSSLIAPANAARLARVVRSHKSHALATAMPPKVTGPPGHACVLKIEIPKPANASNNTGTHELPDRFSDTAAATVPIDKATLPRIASKGAGPFGEPPTMGWAHTAFIAACHASGLAERLAALTSIPVTIPAAVSNTRYATPNTNIAVRHSIAAIPVCRRTSVATANAESGKSRT
jgi:hypothetical protein